MQDIQFRPFHLNISDFELNGYLNSSDIAPILSNINLDNGHGKKLWEMSHDDNGDEWMLLILIICMWLVGCLLSVDV